MIALLPHAAIVLVIEEVGRFLGDYFTNMTDAERISMLGIALAAVRRVSRPTVVEDVFGLPPLDDFPELSPAEIVSLEPPIRLRL